MNENAGSYAFLYFLKKDSFLRFGRPIESQGDEGKSSLFPRWSVYTEISEIWHGTSDGCSAYSTAARFAGHMARRIST